MTQLTPEEVPVLFSDPPSSLILNYQRFQQAQVWGDIESQGYSVVRGLVPSERITRIRNFWIEAFSKVKPSGRVTWGPYFGQANHIGYSKDTFQCLFRACDFLWNDPLDKETREVCLRVHALRNLLINEDPHYGMRFTDGKYGIFVTTSFYPPTTGRMGDHVDGVTDKKRLIHSLVPITFKGTDYKEGGLSLYNRQGKEVDVDAIVTPGDVIFYDGALKHGVKPIVPFANSPLGRIQMFPIPTVFSNLEDNIFAISRIPADRYARAKWLFLKNKIRIALGLSPAMR